MFLVGIEKASKNKSLDSARNRNEKKVKRLEKVTFISYVLPQVEVLDKLAWDVKFSGVYDL